MLPASDSELELLSQAAMKDLDLVGVSFSLEGMVDPGGVRGARPASSRRDLASGARHWIPRLGSTAIKRGHTLI